VTNRNIVLIGLVLDILIFFIPYSYFLEMDK